MPDKQFAKRLNEACDGRPHVPAYGQGRQEWIKKALAISSEAARRYFNGSSRPRPDKMKKLARALEVDEAFPVPVRKEGRLLVVDKAVLERYFADRRAADLARLDSTDH